MKLKVTRTKRPRDAYKASDGGAFPAPAKEVKLTALRMKQDGEQWRVTFKMIWGFKRTSERKMSPFWDTDLGTALLRWNTENGGGKALVSGCDFITHSQEDATMVRMAFA
jgi:hypothetical protein